MCYRFIVRLAMVVLTLICVCRAGADQPASEPRKETRRMATLRVSGVQMLISSKLADNLPKVLHAIRSSDAELILFPEMSLTGYHGNFSRPATEAAWGQISKACQQSHVTALIGTGCQEGAHTYIQTRIFSRQGGVLGTYEKMLPTIADQRFCVPGTELRLFHYGQVPFGCLICNDLWVTPGRIPRPDPRLTCLLGRKGAKVIFHAINSGTSPIHTPFHESNLVLRAMANKLYIVTANAASRDKPINAASGIVSPAGKWLVQVPRTGEHTYVYDLNVELD